MSQSGALSSAQPGAGDLLTLSGDTGGIIVPDGAGNITLIGGDGITTTGDNANASITISTDVETASVTTFDDTETTLYSFTVSAISSVTLNVLINAAESTFNRGIGGTVLVVATRPLLGATSLVGVPNVSYTENIVGDPTFTADVSGNDVRIRVTGVAATTIEWNARIISITT